MYDFSGIVYRIWGVCGVLLTIGVVCILFEKPWGRNFKIQNCKTGLAIIIVSICLGLVYVSKILFPNVSSYTGKFVESHRNSRVAPPLPLTYEYTFWNGVEEKKSFFLDVLSKRKVFAHEFEKGQKYVIYFDVFTNVIVDVEVIE